MYGQPGKCVSCRQKFWVPKADELPADDNLVRLADHPELMRSSGDRIRPEPGAAEALNPKVPVPQAPEITPGTPPKNPAGVSDNAVKAPVSGRLAVGADVGADAGMEEPGAPLDDLEPLREVLAYQHLLERQGQDSAAEKPAGSADTDTCRAYRRVIERARAKIDQRLRELLFETGRLLMAVLGEIAQTTLKFRVGEIGPDAYFETVGGLRGRREWLDRQRVNLKTWLRVQDVYLLGGPAGITLESMNLNRVEVLLPAEVRDDRTLLQKYIGDMREAFDMRSVAERRRAEWQRMVREDELPEEALREGPLQATADARRARARVLHCRMRLRQVGKDCDTDISALQAYQQLLAKGMLPRSRGQLAQEDVLGEARTIAQALADLRLWRDWASNAASAEDPGDLPLSPPTLFRRLREPNERRRAAMELVPAYTAAFCLTLLALLPGVVAKTAFLAGMVLMVVVPAFSSRSRRGAAYVAIWTVETFLMGLTWRFSESDPAAGAYLTNPLHLAWTVVAAFGAWTAMGACATLVLRKLAGGYVWVPPTAGAAGILLFLAALFLGPGATQSESPSATTKAIPAALPSAVGTPAADTAVADTAAAKEPPSAPAPVPAQAAETAPPPVPAPTDTVPPAPPAAVASSGTAVARNGIQDSNPLPNDTSGRAATVGGEDNSGVAAETVPSQLARPNVELRGVMHKEGSQPKFRIILNAPGGRNRTMDIFLGETVYGPWKALEYSASSKKLTLSNAKRLVVLDTGRKIDLPD